MIFIPQIIYPTTFYTTPLRSSLEDTIPPKGKATAQKPSTVLSYESSKGESRLQELQN
jgi:hypothetical protein